jgi:hypothetical protein
MPQYQSFVGSEKHYGETSILWKSELFIRQYLIPYDIVRRLKLSQTGSESVVGVVDEYLRIQVKVDEVTLRTSHCSFSFDDAKLLFDYLYEGLSDDYDQPKWNTHFKLLREKHKEYDAYLKKVIEQKKKKKALPKRQGILRSPWFIIRDITETDLTACCNHFYRYFKVFKGEISFGIRFHFNPELDLHLVACKSDFDDSVLTVIAEGIDKCCAVDYRSVFMQQENKHAFGVGSYVSHGCAHHSTVKLPNVRTGDYIKFAKLEKKKRKRDDGCFDCFVIRCNYGITFVDQLGENISCVEESCYDRRARRRARRRAAILAR